MFDVGFSVFIVTNRANLAPHTSTLVHKYFFASGVQITPQTPQPSSTVFDDCARLCVWRQGASHIRNIIGYTRNINTTIPYRYTYYLGEGHRRSECKLQCTTHHHAAAHRPLMKE